MQAFVDLARCNYDYMEPYILNIGNLTIELINSDNTDAATLALEFWTSLCEVEIERNNTGKPHQNIMSRCYQSLLQILFLALEKTDDSAEDPDLEATTDD